LLEELTRMNLLLQQLLNEGLREEARTWLYSERRIDIKFLLRHVPQIWEAYDNEEIGGYLADGILPHFDTEAIKGRWMEAEQSALLPIGEPWLQLVDLPDGLSLLVPEEGDSAERILLLSPTSSNSNAMLRTLAFDILEGKIAAFHFRRRYCAPVVNGSTCGGACQHGGPCQFRVYVGDGPPRGFCEC
jgi:hypothetical protein